MNGRNKRRWAIRFNVLNQRIVGLNALWGGWNKAYRDKIGVHWVCASLQIQCLYRNILKWPSGLLTVPRSMLSFAAVIEKKGAVYAEADLNMIETYKVKVELVALPKDPPDIIPILSILPDIWRCQYEREENMVTKDRERWEEMRKCQPRLGMGRGEYVKIVQRLVGLGMVRLLPVEQVVVINGLHCVLKENGKQRLIFDGRPVNQVLNIPEKIALPDFSLLTDWEVKGEEVVRFGKLDLDNYYHRLGVPGWLLPYLGLPQLPAKAVGKTGGFLSPVCCTLPMGLSHSVLLAQVAHLHILRSISCSPRINERVKGQSQSWMLLYIDDVIIGAKANTEDTAEMVVNNLVRECLVCYQKAGLLVNQNKLVWAKKEIGGLGCVLSEEKCGIHPKDERMRQVVGATRYVLELEVIKPKHVECLLGNWVWFVLLYRPLYAVFFHVYKWLHVTDDCGYRCLWESVKREFRTIILFADICKLSWNREIGTTALAMDASLLGAGACEVEWSPIQTQAELGQQLPLMNSDGKDLSMKTTRRFTLGRAASTIQTYTAAIAKFKHKVGIVKFDDLDSQLLDYVQSFPPLSQRSASEKIGCACRHFFPEIASTLPRLNRYMHQLRRQYKGISKPPMIWDVVVLVVFQLVTMGFPVTAIGVLLQFDCFLRPVELANIRCKHIAFPGGKLLGSKAKNVLILLPRAKSGPLQSVRVESSLVIKLLKKAVKRNKPEDLLFPSVTVYRQRLRKALWVLELSHIGYTPHSIRHGAATMALINKGERALPGIMFRGRWESSAGKAYLQMGAAALLHAEIPEALLMQAENQEKDLEKIFKHMDWTPMI